MSFEIRWRNLIFLYRSNSNVVGHVIPGWFIEVRSRYWINKVVLNPCLIPLRVTSTKIIPNTCWDRQDRPEWTLKRTPNTCRTRMDSKIHSFRHLVSFVSCMAGVFVFLFFWKIMDQHGINSENQNTILQIFSNEFFRRFKRDHYFDCSQTVILSRATDDEIFQIVHQISLFKALGSDGMHVVFYQQCWNIIIRNICGMI